MLADANSFLARDEIVIVRHVPTSQAIQRGKQARKEAAEKEEAAEKIQAISRGRAARKT